jgi:hypothetical protein
MDKGFLRENDKLPFAVLFKKGIKVNHNRNFIFLCYVRSVVNSVDIPEFRFFSRKRILIAIDEDGNAFEDKCYS